jgi:hypothetical protein
LKFSKSNQSSIESLSDSLSQTSGNVAATPGRSHHAEQPAGHPVQSPEPSGTALLACPGILFSHLTHSTGSPSESLWPSGNAAGTLQAVPIKLSIPPVQSPEPSGTALLACPLHRFPRLPTNLQYRNPFCESLAFRVCFLYTHTPGRSHHAEHPAGAISGTIAERRFLPAQVSSSPT